MRKFQPHGYETIKDGRAPGAGVEVRIEEGPTGQGEFSQHQEPEARPPARRRLFGGILMGLTVCAFVAALVSAPPAAAKAAEEGVVGGDLPMVEAARGNTGVTVRTCSFAECEEAGCDVDLAPFLCTDKSGPYLGCSALPWDPAGGCTASCTLHHCAHTAPPKDATSCAGAPCGDAWCDPEGASGVYQRCGSGAPYQCLKGSAAMGCSADAYGWTLVADTTCSECCDTTTC